VSDGDEFPDTTGQPEEAVSMSKASAGALALADRKFPTMVFTSRERIGTTLSR
jgi:hypothetical protein